MRMKTACTKASMKMRRYRQENFAVLSLEKHMRKERRRICQKKIQMK